jgi:hypothetical protein
MNTTALRLCMWCHPVGVRVVVDYVVRTKYMFYSPCDGILRFTLREIVSNEGCHNLVSQWVFNAFVAGNAIL